MSEQRVFDREPEDRIEPEPAPPPASVGEDVFDRERREEFRRRWLEVQSSFIDEPHLAVDRAEDLLRELFAEISGRLEASRGTGEPSTESLRKTLQGYRSLFERIVAL